VTPEARYPAALLTVLLLWTAALGIAPHFRQDWLLENVLVLVSVPLLVATYKQLRFSNAAYTCLFAFFMLHELGAHYTYSLVPYDAWGRALLGVSIDAILGFDRNMFDRAVHFLYGVLMTPAVVELFAVKAPPVGVWRFLMPLFFMNSHAVIYETIEWLAAEAFGGELGAAYLGTQGDPFDAQKDMALAFLGTLLSLSVVLWWRRRARGPAPHGSS
jgi:putative membrane protein